MYKKHDVCFGSKNLEKTVQEALAIDRFFKSSMSDDYSNKLHWSKAGLDIDPRKLRILWNEVLPSIPREFFLDLLTKSKRIRPR